MDGTSKKSGSLRLAHGDRQACLIEVVESLEASLKTLEALDLTLAAALLDHATAEVKRQLTP